MTLRATWAQGVSEQLSLRLSLRDDPDRLEQRRERIRRRVPTTVQRWTSRALEWFELREGLGPAAAARAAWHVECWPGSCNWCRFCALSRSCGMRAIVVGAPSW